MNVPILPRKEMRRMFDIPIGKFQQNLPAMVDECGYRWDDFVGDMGWGKWLEQGYLSGNRLMEPVVIEKVIRVLLERLCASGRYNFMRHFVNLVNLMMEEKWYKTGTKNG